MARVYKSVHDSHCCAIHGCKYGDEDCPVVAGTEIGVHCEICGDDFNENENSLEKALVDLTANYNCIEDVIDETGLPYDRCVEIYNMIESAKLRWEKVAKVNEAIRLANLE